jgi:predicted phosphohydrolase
MSIWAIADLHLAFGLPDKSMEVFGPPWEGYTEKIEKNWRASIASEDLVLIPGDISWAMRAEQARLDLNWIDQLPGTKVLLRGNHDYWWNSASKIKQVLPPSCHFIQHNSFTWKDIVIAGSRLWDTSEFNFNHLIHIRPNIKAKLEMKKLTEEEQEKVFQRELRRLEMSLKSINPKAKTRIVMTHYPPISADLQDSSVSRLLESYHVDICVFGHLHNVKEGLSVFGCHHGIQYFLTSCDYLNFQPVLIYSETHF